MKIEITDKEQQLLQPQQTININPMQQPDNYEKITADELYQYVSRIRDPEHHQMSLEYLNVIQEDSIYVNDEESIVNVEFVPTTPNCSMGSILGLSIKALLIKILPRRFIIHVNCKPETHEDWQGINMQLNDKERVMAALQNPNVKQVIEASIQYVI